MDVAAVILNWNQASATLRAAEALFAWSRPPAGVWIVDNASTDGSRTLVPARCPAARYLYGETNLGFAGGANRALRRILETPAEAVLLLNNDADLPEDQARRLEDALVADPRLVAVGPVLDESAGLHRRLSAGGRDIARHVETRILVGPDGLEPAAGGAVRRVDYVPGAAALIRTAAFRSIGLFDEAYFFSGELADWCRRARRAGYACAVCLRARAGHAAPASGPVRDTLYRYYTLRNRFLYVRAEHAGIAGAGWAAGWALAGLAMAARALAGGRPAAARAAWLAVQDGLGGRFGNRNALFGFP